MEAWASWAAFLAIVGAAYWYYSQNDRNKARGRSTQRTTTTSSAKQPVQWSDEEKKSAVKPEKAKAKAPRKSVKKAVQEAGDKAEAYLSGASSTAGMDADDDLSPAASPSLGAAAPSGKNVSDMLESKGPAPGVLKINASEKPARQAKQQQARPETPQETKKQRQNRKKAEEAKAQREEDEKQRQALLEKQRRTAREARGEPAKNGLQTTKAPTSNPWTTVGSSGSVQAPVAAPSGQLLDTFEAASTASSSEAATNGTAPTPDSLSNSYTNLPSEEEQMRLAMEESAWTTVPKGGKKQRKANEEGNDSGVPQEAAPVSVPAPAPVKPVQAKKSENTKPTSRYEVLSEPVSNASHPMDSDWPVV